MKTQRQSPRLALRLSAMEGTRWCWLGFQVEDDFQDQHGASAEQISQIDGAADCAGSLDQGCCPVRGDAWQLFLKKEFNRLKKLKKVVQDANRRFLIVTET